MFGRRKQDEDPFGALKDGGTYQSQPITIPDIGGNGPSSPTLGTGASPGLAATPITPSVTPSATPSAASSMTAPPASPPPTTSMGQLQSYGSNRRRSGFGASGFGLAMILRILIPLLVIGAFAIPAIHFGNTVSKLSIPSFSTPSFSTPSVSTPATPVPPTPRRAASYLTPGGVRAGLAHIARVVPGARVVLLRIDANSLSATAVLPGGRAKLVYFGPTATMVTGTTAPGETPVAISRIRPGVVGRLVAAMGARFHVPASRIDYMVVSSPPGLAPQWIIFSKTAAHRGYSASLDGSGLAPLP